MNNNKIQRVGIVAEYNPFHNGHIFQINWIKNKWPKAKIVVILSGKYVQRGEIAIASFYERSRICKEYGVDEVYELDFWHATQAAHVFAQGAIDKLYEVKVDAIVFGSETNNANAFKQVANLIYSNETKYYSLLRQEMKKGYSFPKANEIVCQDIVGKSFKMPNDILGLEYVKAIIKNQYNIEIYCIKRNVGFNSDEINGNITSASHIRKMIFENNNEYQKFTPMKFNKIPDRIENYFEDFKKIVNKLTNEELKNIHLISEGMENLFKKNINLASTYDEFVSLTNSKRYTSSRIKRAMLYVLLQIKKTQ